MSEDEGVGQCLLRYEHNARANHCGMTFFQCGKSAILILTDLEQWTSITNSIESAASTARAMHFLHVPPQEMMFFEHYPRNNPVTDSFCQVKMDWDFRAERFKNPQFSEVQKNQLEHLLSCYGYAGRKVPNMTFKKAEVIPFRAARMAAGHH